MNDNLITWTPQNMITVFLMALVGWAVLGLIVRFGKSRMAASGSGYGASAPGGAS
jgi:hypothetical protein